MKAVFLYLLRADHASMNVSLYTVAVGVWQAAGRAAAALAKTVVKHRSSYVGITFDDQYTDLFGKLMPILHTNGLCYADTFFCHM